MSDKALHEQAHVRDFLDCHAALIGLPPREQLTVRSTPSDPPDVEVLNSDAGIVAQFELVCPMIDSLEPRRRLLSDAAESLKESGFTGVLCTSDEAEVGVIIAMIEDHLQKLSHARWAPGAIRVLLEVVSCNERDNYSAQFCSWFSPVIIETLSYTPRMDAGGLVDVICVYDARENRSIRLDRTPREQQRAIAGPS